MPFPLYQYVNLDISVCGNGNRGDPSIQKKNYTVNKTCTELRLTALDHLHTERQMPLSHASGQFWSTLHPAAPQRGQRYNQHQRYGPTHQGMRGAVARTTTNAC
jgi:hypothetical protein